MKKHKQIEVEKSWKYIAWSFWMPVLSIAAAFALSIFFAPFGHGYIVDPGTILAIYVASLMGICVNVYIFVQAL
jgi:hypothetical protein